MLGRHRLIDVAPWKPLVEQSPVLATLAREPRGTRIADRRLRNMPMVAGLAPISAYRTLDLPAVGSLTALAMGSLSDPRIEAEVRARPARDGDRSAAVSTRSRTGRSEVLRRTKIDRADDRRSRAGGLAV